MRSHVTVKRRLLVWCGLVFTLALAGFVSVRGPGIASRVLAIAGVQAADRATAAERRVRPALEKELAALGVAWGVPVHVRLYKQEAQLEVWVRDSPRWRFLRAWPVCTYSGTLGPKVKQGDMQAPEGFYRVGRGQLNPASQFHLSFNLGYPNAYDRAHGRTGDYLMVHGNCVSIGCYAMGDAAIEEIYTLVAAAIANGQREVPVHVFPFKFRDADDPRLDDARWGAFWRNLRDGALWFDTQGVPPAVAVRDKTYVFSAP